VQERGGARVGKGKKGKKGKERARKRKEKGGKMGGKEKEQEGDTRQTNPSVLPVPLKTV